MTELDAARTAWEHTARAVVALGQDCSDADFARPTECPGWTVKDQISHVVGIESWLLGEPYPRHRVPDLPHLRSDFGRLVEVAVDVRRQVPGPRVVAELADVVERRGRALADPQLRPDTTVPSPLGGELSLLDQLRLRTFDVWTHEQDIRRALDRPGDLDSPAAEVAVGWIRRVLPRVVARGARVEPGRVVVLDVEGRGGFTDAVSVLAGQDGKPSGRVLPEPPADPDAVLAMTTEAFMRRSAGRWSAEDTPVQVTGDPDLARRVLDAMVVTP